MEDPRRRSASHSGMVECLWAESLSTMAWIFRPAGDALSICSRNAMNSWCRWRSESINCPRLARLPCRIFCSPGRAASSTRRSSMRIGASGFRAAAGASTAVSRRCGRIRNAEKRIHASGFARGASNLKPTLDIPDRNCRIIGTLLRTPRSAAKAGSARRAEARQNSPFALRQSATSQRPRAREPCVRPSSATASRSQIPKPNRRCNFSMTDPPCRIIGAKLADAEPRVQCVLLIGPGRESCTGLRVSAPDRGKSLEIAHKAARNCRTPINSTEFVSRKLGFDEKQHVVAADLKQ